MSGDGGDVEFERDGPIPIYVQLADEIEGLITSGTLKAGQRLSAERDLAEEYGVAYLTVRRAMAELRARQLIKTVHGKGTYVVGPRSDEES